MTTNASKYAVLVAAGVMALVITARASDIVTTYFYFRNSAGTWVPGGSHNSTDDRFGGKDYAVLCDGTTCVFEPERWCGGCHAGAVDMTRFRNHVSTYFPRASFLVAEGQRTKMGTLVVTRLNGLLVLEDERGRRFQLPPTALVMKGRDGRPLYVGYPGATPPLFK